MDNRKVCWALVVQCNGHSLIMGGAYYELIIGFRVCCIN